MTEAATKEAKSLTGPTANQLQSHQQRVVDEKDALQSKLGNLEGFLGGAMYGTLQPAEQSRLSRQFLIMQLYEQVLSERISAF